MGNFEVDAWLDRLVGVMGVMSHASMYFGTIFGCVSAAVEGYGLEEYATESFLTRRVESSQFSTKFTSCPGSSG